MEWGGYPLDKYDYYYLSTCDANNRSFKIYYCVTKQRETWEASESDAETAVS